MESDADSKYEVFRRKIEKVMKLSQNETSMTFERMIGFSNEVYKVVVHYNHKPQEDKMYILKKKKKDKPNSDFTVEEQHIKAMLKEFDYGPLQIFEDEEYRFEEFVESTTCTFAEFQVVEIFLEAVRQVAIYSSLFLHHRDRIPFPDERKSFLTRCIERGVIKKSFKNLTHLLESPETQLDKSKLKEIFNFLKTEALDKFTMDLISSVDKEDMIVCHNDFFWLNTLKKKDGELMIIDYEYSGFNPIGWDLAIYFSERNFVFDETTNEMNFKSRPFSQLEIDMACKIYLISLQKGKESQKVTSSYIDDISKGRLDNSLDLPLFTRISNKRYFTSLIVCINLLWILMYTVLLKEQEEWPWTEYLRERISYHRTMVKQLKETPEYNEYMI